MSPWLQQMPSFREVCLACRAHGLKGLAVSAIVFAIIAAVTLALPRTYYSEAKIFVKVGWPSLTLDPTATTGQNVSIYESRESEINSILEVLRSRQITAGVIDLLGTDALLHRGPLPNLATLGALNPSPHEASSERQRSQAMQLLDASMHIYAPKKSNIIVLRCEASSPELTRAINTAYLTVFQHVHAEVNQTKGSYEFFVEQEQVLRDKWQTATNELRDAKDQLSVATLEGRSKMLESQLSGVEEQLLGTQAELAATQGKITSLRAKLQTTAKYAETSRAENANAGGDLYKLHMKEKEFASRYTDQHPQVVDIREQIAALEKLGDGQGNSWVQSTSSLNPAWSQLESALLTESSSLDSLLARATSLSGQRDVLRGQLRQLNTDEIRITELQQAVDVTQKSYYETAERREQARIHSQLANQRITNVNVFQAASFIDKPIAPKRSLILALGLLVSALSGVGTVAGLANLPRRFHSLEELAERLQLPIITTLPPTFRPAL